MRNLHFKQLLDLEFFTSSYSVAHQIDTMDLRDFAGAMRMQKRIFFTSPGSHSVPYFNSCCRYLTQVHLSNSGPEASERQRGQ